MNKHDRENVTWVALQWKRLNAEQPTAVTADLESWIALKLSWSSTKAKTAAEWARKNLPELV